MKVYFLFDKEKDNKLFHRASLEILSINGDIPKVSADFISPEQEEAFEHSLREADEETICMYKLYKLVHYLEIISSVRITRMAADFLRDDHGNYWLLNVSGLKHVHQPKHFMNVESEHKIYRKAFEAETGKLARKLDLEYRDLEKKEIVRLINKILKQYYDINKKNSIENEFEIYLSEKITDEQFARLLPDAPFTLSGLLKEKKDYGDIQKFILKRVRKIKNDRLIREGALEDVTVQNKLDNFIGNHRGSPARNLRISSWKGVDSMLQSRDQTSKGAGRIALKSLLQQQSNFQLPGKDSEVKQKSKELLMALLTDLF